MSFEYSTPLVNWENPNAVYIAGYELPSGIKVVADNEVALAIKIPGHMYWSGRGEQSYASPEFVVFKKPDDLNRDCKEARLTSFVSWYNKRKAK